ncbi:hypothetical protein Q4R27_15980 [Morganella morganii subsp. sibonii]
MKKETGISVYSSDDNSNLFICGKSSEGKTVSLVLLQQQQNSLKASPVQIVMMNSNIRLNLKKEG